MRLLGVLVALCLVPACAVPPPPDPKVPGMECRRIISRRACAVIVTDRDDLSHWVRGGFTGIHEPGDAEGGSATPIAPDGYFLTADHVLMQVAARNVFVLFGRDGRLVPVKARVVWRSQREDLALLHIPESTPEYYHWSPPGQWLPSGTLMVHGGIATGLKSQPGKLSTTLAPEGAFTGTRKFKIDIPLQPGDSGGPVVNAYGNLVGINSAVEFLVPMETAFFINSEAKRPNTRTLMARVQADRARNPTLPIAATSLPQSSTQADHARKHSPSPPRGIIP